MRPYILKHDTMIFILLYLTNDKFDVLSFDELQFDVKSSQFQQLKNMSNKIRRIAFSVIDVYKVFIQMVHKL